jgi:hypothetical protein
MDCLGASITAPRQSKDCLGASIPLSHGRMICGEAMSPYVLFLLSLFAQSGTASLSAKAKAQLRLKAKHEMEATKLEGHAQQQEGTHGEHTGAVKDKVPKDERVQVDAGSRGRQGGGAQRSSGADVKRARTAVTWLHGISSQAPVAKARHTELVGIPVERGGVAGGHPLVRAVWNAAQGVHAARRSGEWGGEWRESSAWEAAREEKERQEQDEQGEEQQEQQFAAAERVQRVQDEEEDRKRMNQERWWQTREAQKKVSPLSLPSSLALCLAVLVMCMVSPQTLHPKP